MVWSCCLIVERSMHTIVPLLYHSFYMWFTITHISSELQYTSWLCIESGNGIRLIEPDPLLPSHAYQFENPISQTQLYNVRRVIIRHIPFGPSKVIAPECRSSANRRLAKMSTTKIRNPAAAATHIIKSEAHRPNPEPSADVVGPY